MAEVSGTYNCIDFHVHIQSSFRDIVLVDGIEQFGDIKNVVFLRQQLLLLFYSNTIIIFLVKRSTVFDSTKSSRS